MTIMRNDLIQELINEAAIEFYNHLSLDKNDRILFSGKFGKGKTTFLNEFFTNQKKYAGTIQYNVIFLDPVNYTVSSNEDIFKYIKYDILLHLLLNRFPELDSIEFTFNEVAKYYLAKNPFQLVEGLLKHIPKVGMFLDNMLPHIKKLRETIIAQKKAAEAVTEDRHVTDFIIELQSEDYSIYENDIITELIRKLLVQDNKLQNVLVIDNLDRIDPEHIFRILNIFSAHMNYHLWDQTFNKFQFDKIILVCDIQNIRNIYANRYGSNVDFSGYIDKFYSVEIFYFQNYDQLRTTCHKVLRTLHLKDAFDNLRTLNDYNRSYGIFYLLTTLVFQNQISLRQLVDFCSYPMPVLYDTIKSNNGINEKEIHDTPVLEMIILAKILTGYSQLCKVIELLLISNTPVNEHEKHFKYMLHFKLFQLYGDAITGDRDFHFDNRQFTLSVVGDMFNYTRFQISIKSKTTGALVPFQPNYNDFYKLYLEILSEFHQLKIIE